MIWCLHGNLGHPSDWDVLKSSSNAFSNHVIRKVDLWRYLDCRSIGLEEFGEIFSSEVSAQDSAPYLIGYSMGGRLALNALLAAPSLWKGACLLSTHPGLKSEGERTARRSADAVWGAKALKLDWASFLREWNGQGVLGRTPSNMADRYLLQPRSQAIARAFYAWSLGEQKDFRELSRQIICPVTQITGQWDEKFTQLAKEYRFPHGEHHIISSAKHRPLWENPEETISYIRAACNIL